MPSGGGMGLDWADAAAMGRVVSTISGSGRGMPIPGSGRGMPIPGSTGSMTVLMPSARLPSEDVLPSFAMFNLNLSRVSFAAKVRVNSAFIE